MAGPYTTLPGDNPPPSTGTTGTTTTSSSAPSGPSDAERMAMARLRTTYEEVLRRWGMKPDKNLLNLIERGGRGQWSTTQFMSFLRQTPQYRQHFRGIQWRVGMTEGQYNSTFAQYRDRAADIGERLSRKEFALALRKGKSYEEFNDTINAIQSLSTYAPFWTQMQQTLELRGVDVPGQKLTKNEMVKFIMGLGPKKWETLFQEVYITTQLEKVAGIQVVARRAGEVAAPDSYDITRNDILKIIKNVEATSPGMELEKLSGADFAEIGSFVKQHSISYMQRYGLSTADLITSRLGGPGAAAIAERSRRVLATQEAFNEPRAVATGALTASQDQPDEELPQSR